jgi:hypothetical protein
MVIALMLVIALTLVSGGLALASRALADGLRCRDPEEVFCGVLIGAASLMPLAIVWELLCAS